RALWPLVAAAAALLVAVVLWQTGGPGAPALATIVSCGEDARLVGTYGKLTLSPGQPVRSGDQLLSGKDPLAVRLADGTRLDLAPATGATLADDHGLRIDLASGGLVAEVVPRAASAPLLVFTAQATATVLASSFELVADGAGTRLDVRAGEVHLENPRGRLVVAAGVRGFAPTDEAPRALPATIIVDFTPGDIQPANGTLVDFGLTYDPTRGYGWDGPIEGAPAPGAGSTWDDVFHPLELKRRASPSSRAGGPGSDGLCAGWRGASETWRMRLPNGRYRATIRVGDDFCNQGPHHVRIQDRQVISAVMTAKNEFFERSAEVVVSDGELRMRVGGHDSPEVASDLSSDSCLTLLVIDPLDRP
ncbi:MAG: FecR domain-containing protein, partial [Planctomycetes bacterium]|nr:FecR domain-containing protein [Planctomycetota bacterium]